MMQLHLGCTFDDILRAEGHVISGGLLTLLVFVRGNQAHMKFLKESKVKSNYVLMPNPHST